MHLKKKKKSKDSLHYIDTQMCFFFNILILNWRLSVLLLYSQVHNSSLGFCKHRVKKQEGGSSLPRMVMGNSLCLLLQWVS